jgi:hypothetical protein
MKKIIALISVAWILVAQIAYAQDDLLALVNKNEPAKKQFINNAFKSSRVINGHSMEFIGKGIMDFRILHRFGEINTGVNNLYGLDQANMRIGFDYGLTKDLTVGFGRSNVNKEWDGFIKYRPIQQSTGGKGSSPVSLILVTGMTLSTTPWADPLRKNFFTSRMNYYNQIIIGRKFSERFSLQLSPTHVHLNLVPYNIYSNDIFAMGIGSRLKITKRTAFVVDYHYIIKPDMFNFEDDEEGSSGGKSAQFINMINPLSIGFDIETGGHVFQLHFSNSTGMNEKAFITNTTKSWGKGEIRFGFNLSRVFAVGRK